MQTGGLTCPQRRGATAIEIQVFLDWLTAHPQYAALAVFTIAMTESLAVVGLIVPGAVLMVATGTLIGMGTIQFWPLMLAAIAGAAAGDGASFWLGRHYQDALRKFWPFNRHPQWLTQGEEYFRRHGGKSIVLGRFVGPVRPFVPVVAGMLRMRPRLFFAVNLFSAVLWAPCYLLPGVAFGASLALAGEVAARLVVMLVAAGLLAWLVFWSVRRLYRWLAPRVDRSLQRLLERGRRHPYLQRLVGGLLDPSRPGLKSLSILALLLIGASWIFFSLVHSFISGDTLSRLDQGVFHSLQTLRTPWGDRVMVYLTELGDTVVIGAVALTVLALLLWRRSRGIAGYWIVAVLFAQVAAVVIEIVLRRPPLSADIEAGLFGLVFRGNHVMMSTVVYGFLALLVARHLPDSRRWALYAAVTLLVLLIASSRLFLGVNSLSSIAAGTSLGVAWLCLLGIAYVQHRPQPGATRGLAAAVLVTLLLAGAWHFANRHGEDLQRYAPRPQLQQQQAARWWQDGWRTLPAYRIDLEGDYEQPLNLQWHGDLAAIREVLQAQGWRAPPPLGARAMLHWLSPDAELKQLPLLPQVHDGRHEILLMIGANGGQRFGLRLWQSNVALSPGDAPLWVGSITALRQRHFLLFRVPVTSARDGLPLAVLQSLPAGIEQRLVTRAAPVAGRFRSWDGAVLLLRTRAADAAAGADESSARDTPAGAASS